MKRACAALALILAACAPPQPQAPAAAVATTRTYAGCTAQSSHDWSAVGSQYYVVEAEATGETCASASATLRIKSRGGVVLFERAYQIADVPLAFNPGNDQTGLRADLEAWTQNAAETPTADTLPAWPAGAARPPYFQPAVRRGPYEAARGAQGPLFCYPDGAESNACLALAGDHATFLGSLTPERE
ncbi:MAG: hypothetical protein ABL864_06965 [Terricaulis sp.]